jgi:tetratricopeptide (TPR) repeat protein
MNSLARSLDDVGRIREALELYEETLKLRKAKLGLDHPDTLISMNNLAERYIAVEQVDKAMTIIQETLASRERRAQAEPGNSMEQSCVAWTQGQMGEAEEARHAYAAAVQAYVKSVAMFEKAHEARALNPFFLNRLDRYRQRLTLCRKAEQTVMDLDFALKQPAVEVPRLLDMRVRALAAKKDKAGVVATAEAYAKLAEKNPKQVYNAACAWSLAMGVARGADPGTPRLFDEYAGKAIALLKKTPTGPGQFFATPAALTAHMKQDKDLDPLRQR